MQRYRLTIATRSTPLARAMSRTAIAGYPDITVPMGFVSGDPETTPDLCGTIAALNGKRFLLKCPACSSELQEGKRFCADCGAEVSPQTSVTRSPAGGAIAATPAARSKSSPDSERFAPGTVLADRYRIVSLLGRGGMGEVFRADDLKLGQPVAIKLLREHLQNDPGRLQRFLNEARVALQVTHPNVCRVYDIGEIEGTHYLSMEYIDG